MVTGYTTGVFDMFHIGHLNVLTRARDCCDWLIVGVMSDELCAIQKGKRPIIPQDERMAIVAGLRCVDQVVVQSDLDYERAWEELRFHCIFKGDDWKGHPRWIELEKKLGPLGVETVFFPYTKGASSTQLRELLDALLETKEDRSIHL